MTSQNSCVLVLLILFGCSTYTGLGQDPAYIMTVNGKLSVHKMGKTLVHEHIITNFNGTKNPNQPIEDEEKAINLILPHLKYLKNLGYSTLFECTPSYIGKNVRLLQRLSELSGIHMVTNTGYYAAVNKKYLPESVYAESAGSLAEKWYKEWDDGIANTGIRPGFIKLGVGEGELDQVEQKIVKAGMILSSKTGMAIAVHTGGGTSIRSQASLARKHNFDLNKLIWVHAQNGTDLERLEMANQGIWISLDGVSGNRIEEYLEMIVALRQQSLLSRLLLSHDDGWAIDHDQGNLELNLFGNENDKPYSTISEVLIPKLFELGFTKKEIDLIMVDNPKKAFRL
jgi:phosphotriesterase-related protein